MNEPLDRVRPTHPNPRIEAMAKAAYMAWNEGLIQPTWERASFMTREKFYRMVGRMLEAAVTSKERAGS
jgi:hypothetical protein